MNIFYSIFLWFNGLKFRTKLFVFYVALLILPIVFIGIRYYSISMDVITRLASENVYEVVKKNNEIIDAKLSKIEEGTLAIIGDADIFNTFNRVKDVSSMNIIDMDRSVSKAISKYFGQSPDIYSVQIATTYYTFTNNENTIYGDNYKNSNIYQWAVEGKGKLIWIPTYDYTQMFNYKELKDVYIENRYFFSAARLLNTFYLNNGVFQVLDNSTERPVLIVNIKAEFFKNMFQDSITAQGADYFIVTKEGQVISNSDINKINTFEDYPWLDEVVSKGSGISFVKVNGQKVIACYDTSKVTGWISVIVMPVNGLMGDIVLFVKHSMVYIVMLIVIVLLFLAFFISRQITKPMEKLIAAMKGMGEGNFDTHIPIEEAGEFDYVIKRFNKLNDKIKILIEENYKTKLREKETEIMALNLQLNPHFLYNTLNIVNWMAIEANNKEVSDMIMKLCDMLVYTVRDKNELVSFEDDIKWLRYYLDIMAVRFEDKFTVQFDVDPPLMRSKVPKLFLQPLIENAIVHGLEEMEEGGLIKVVGTIKDNERIFIVSDNGKGISNEKISEIFNTETSSVGIINVHKRIKLLYGEEYGISIYSEVCKGTTILVKLPME